MTWLTGIVAVLTALFLLVSGQTVQLGNNANDPGRTLVLLAATSRSDPYYGAYADAVTNFQIEFAKRISAAGDNVIVLAPRETAPQFRAALADDQVLTEEMYDIWIRDFGLVRINKPTALVLGNTYMSDSEAASIQNRFLRTIKAYCPGQSIQLSDIVGDGGNVVDNFVDTAIVTRRIVTDNAPLSQYQVRRNLQRDLGYQNMVFVPDGGDKTGHADGMLSFIDTNQLAITGTLRDEPQVWANTLRDLYQQVPQLYDNILELNSTYQSDRFDGFDSACGLHINALLTGNNLFVPVFGQDPANQRFGQSTRRDQTVVQAIRGRTNRRVVEVPVPNVVCRMGGSVRCLSTAVQGALAQCLVRQAQAQANG